MQAMLDVDEHHWWYRGRRADHRRRAGTPADSHAGSRARRRLRLGTDAARARALRRGIRHRARRGCGARSPRSAWSVRRPHRASVEELPWPDGSFDLITCLDVIEHTPDDVVALRELLRVSKPGGWLLVTVPAYAALWSRHDDRQPPLPPLCALVAAQRGAVRRLGAGEDDLLQRPAARAGRDRAARPAAAGH